MEDRVYTARRGASVVAWIALVVAIGALVLAWVAYNRTGADLEQQIQNAVEAAAENTQEAADAVDAGPDGVDEDDTDVQPAN